MKKRIVITLNTSWNIFNFRLNLARTLKETGYKVIFVAPYDRYSNLLQEEFEYHSIYMNNKGTNPIEDIRLIFDFYRLYKKLSPDVILQYTIKPNIYGSFAAGLLGIPVISNISGLGTVFLNDSFSSKVARFLYRVALKVPKKVFFQNSHDRDLFIDAHLVKSAKTALLPGSGIDTKKFMPCLEKKVPCERVTFLFVARLVKDKGLVEYVEAARKLCAQKKKQVAFYILGPYYEGNPTAIGKEQMQAWEDEGIVTYLGVSDDVQSVMHQYDCVVLPSYREGLSRVLLEAASLQKPIVTTNVPGCKEVVEDGVNGYLCELKNADSLAEQMEKIVALSHEERFCMGERGREKVLQEFDESIVIEHYAKAIVEVLESSI